MSEAAIVSQKSLLQRIPGVAIVLVTLIAVFGAIAPGFLSAANLSLRDKLPWCAATF